MKLPKLLAAAAVAAMFPIAAGAQSPGVSGSGTANTESVPHSQPASPFNQGIGGVGNQGQVGSGSMDGARGYHARDGYSAGDMSSQGYGASPSGAGAASGSATSGEMWAHCQGMASDAMRDRCVRDYTMNYGAAGDPDGRFFNRHIGGVGGVPPQ